MAYTAVKEAGEIVRVACKLCGRETRHAVLSCVHYGDSDDDAGSGWLKVHQIIQCQGCEELSFRIEASDSDTFVQDEDGDIVYLKEEEVFPHRLMGRLGIDILDTFHLEASLRGIYKETSSALSSKLPVLAAIGMRAIVEMVCKDQKPKGEISSRRLTH